MPRSEVYRIEPGYDNFLAEYDPEDPFWASYGGKIVFNYRGKPDNPRQYYPRAMVKDAIRTYNQQNKKNYFLVDLIELAGHPITGFYFTAQFTAKDIYSDVVENFEAVIHEDISGVFTETKVISVCIVPPPPPAEEGTTSAAEGATSVGATSHCCCCYCRSRNAV
ncbi:hypothetical protein ACP275_06G065100 [Erythranthe tilingii]